MLEVKNVTHAYADKPVLRNISLKIEQGEIVCLLGPSGCGKTTLLRIITGLEEGYQGEVLLDDESIKTIPVHQRGFGLMFQDYALFPHMNVAQNVAFGLKMQNITPAEQTRRVQETLNLVGLSGFEKRDVSELSGGEKQRVALARSLAPEPSLLMLDEPLGSLDALLRERLVIEMRNIIKSAGLTAIYVTHDRQEAFAIADRIAIMNAGQIEQIGTPEEVYRQPRTVFVARFLGLNNILPVLRITSQGAETPIGTFPAEGSPQYLLLHPDGIHISNSGTLSGKVIEQVFQGENYRLSVYIKDDVVLTFKVRSEINLPRPGSPVKIGVNQPIGLQGE
jgi:thiamine transport system ATP-binding protein